MAAPLQEQSALGWTNRKPVSLINEALRSLLATVWVPATCASPAHKTYFFLPGVLAGIKFALEIVKWLGKGPSNSFISASLDLSGRGF